MAKTAKKKYTPAINKRFLLIMDELIKEGHCDNDADFFESIGGHRSDQYAYENGTRSPTLEQLATACEKWGYSPTWVILGTGSKKLQVKDQKTIEDRVSELEVAIASLRNIIKRKK